MKKYMNILRLVATYGQLGFTLITPPVVMALLGWLIQSKLGLGTWVMLVCLLIGLLTSGTSAWKFCQQVVGSDEKKAKAEPTEKPVVFYTHE